MTVRPPRILDATAIVGFFHDNRRLFRLRQMADEGKLQLVFPTTAIAEAQAVIDHSFHSWYALIEGDNVRSVGLAEHAAIECGTWPGSLVVRHVAYEARAMRGVVVTCDRTLYKDYDLDVHVL
ncbi:hypothetical protein [Verrucosispora sp. NA02020]|uniref:hypothetical protein n=1 Tax=Verrucosispora sp. NA02020 TaxID=2742132 RepID=UPI0015909402|nr:hypothetical protein [Verrucosispora sp. NA02020]QKW15455.1 hypothetical protein HUT12_23585 [Verrucosispora sp. NA02020]